MTRKAEHAPTPKRQHGGPARPRLGYWQALLAVFFLGWVFMYADRTVLSPVLPAIGREWRLSTGQLGLISSLFFLAYAALQIPTGLLADRFGRKLLLVPGYLFFGVATALSALAPSYGVFLLLAVLTGLGEGTYYAPQFSLSTEAIPLRVRGIGSAIINSGQAFGISLGFIVSGWVAFGLGDGWRASFVVLGAATVVAGIVFLLVMREHPPTGAQARGSVAAPARAVLPGATALLEDDPLEDVAIGNTSLHSVPLRQKAPNRGSALFTRDLVFAYAVMFCSLYGFFVILTWLPYYLQVARGVAPATTGLIASLVPWASLPGALGFSYLSDRMGKRRLLAMAMLPAAAVAMLLIPLAPGMGALFAVLILYGLVGKLALDPIMVAFVADRVPRRSSSSAFALFNFAGMSSSILAPLVTGALRERFGSLKVGFYLAAALLLLGAVCVAFTHAETRSGAPPRMAR